jgi:hypothetical protein
MLILRKRQENNSESRERKNQESAKILEGKRKQLEKHVNRLAINKVRKEYEQKLAFIRPGSGQNWIN